MLKISKFISLFFRKSFRKYFYHFLEQRALYSVMLAGLMFFEGWKTKSVCVETTNKRNKSKQIFNLLNSSIFWRTRFVSRLASFAIPTLNTSRRKSRVALHLFYQIRLNKTATSNDINVHASKCWNAILIASVRFSFLLFPNNSERRRSKKNNVFNPISMQIRFNSVYLFE